MLTGDKVETATCIAISAGFKSRSQQFFFMKELKDTLEVDLHLTQFESKTSSILMIDGNTLDICMATKKMEEKFFKIATLAPCVCVCRCSPT
jgi:phospholipid-translocating ATPase